MHSNQPIAYPLLSKGVPVLSSDGAQIGIVEHVVAAPEQDIFHGLVISSAGRGRRFVQADDIASLHEDGVDLALDEQAALALPPARGGAPEYEGDPAALGSWGHWVRRLTLRSDWRRRD